MYIKKYTLDMEPILSPSGEQIIELIGTSDELGKADNHSLAQVIIPPGASSPRHRDKHEESYYIIGGKGRIVIDDEEKNLGSGDCVLIKEGSVHQIFNASPHKILIFLVISAPAFDSAKHHEM